MFAGRFLPKLVNRNIKRCIFLRKVRSESFVQNGTDVGVC